MKEKITLGEPIIINGRKLSLSRAVKAGDYIFCTGQVPMKDGKVMTLGTIEEQTTAVIKDIENTLSLAECTLNDVVKSMVWLSNKMISLDLMKFIANISKIIILLDQQFLMNF